MKTIIQRSLRLAAAAACLMAAAMLAGCAGFGCDDDTHSGHSDFITRQAGDAVAVNKAVQTDDPWPKEARKRKLDVDGKRAEVAIKRYEQNKSVPPKGLNTTTISGQAGPGAQQSTSIQN